MVAGTLQLFSDSDLSRLQNCTYSILEKTGLRVYNDCFLDSLESAGALVQKSETLVKFPPQMVDDFVSEHRKSNWQPEREEKLPEGKQRFELSGVIAPFTYDYDLKSRRLPLKKDLCEIIHWADMDLDPNGTVGLAVTLSDEDPRIEPIAAYRLLLEHSHRPGDAYVLNTDQIPYLVELATVFYGQPVFPRGTDFVTAPLTFDQRLAEYTLAAIRFGKKHFNFGSMPICGSNSPMTLAGTVALGAAELIGAALIVRSLLPDATFSLECCNGYTDMRTVSANFNSPEALLTDLGVVELINRRFGGHASVAAGSDYIDAHLPGIQAAYERVFRAMAISAFTGKAFRLGGQGTLGAGQIFSPIQFILERDLSAGLWRLGQGIAVDDENLALDVIAKIGPGERGFYLDSDHTRKHYRQGVFSQFLHRGAYDGDEVELARDRRMLEAANQHYKDAIARYTPPLVDPIKLKEMESIVDRARKDLQR